MSTSSPAFLHPPWFFVFFAVMLLAIGVAVSYAPGWRALAERFRSTRSIEGERFRFVSGSIGASTWLSFHYRGCLFVTIGPEGFLLSLFFPFRLGAPSLFIPWTELESVTRQPALFVDRTVIRIRGSSTKIMVVGRAGKRIGEAYEQFASSGNPSREAEPAGRDGDRHQAGYEPRSTSG